MIWLAFFKNSLLAKDGEQFPKMPGLSIDFCGPSYYVTIMLATIAWVCCFQHLVKNTVSALVHYNTINAMV